jgi:hypothetical protein
MDGAVCGAHHFFQRGGELVRLMRTMEISAHPFGKALVDTLLRPWPLKF